MAICVHCGTFHPYPRIYLFIVHFLFYFCVILSHEVNILLMLSTTHKFQITWRPYNVQLLIRDSTRVSLKRKSSNSGPYTELVNNVSYEIFTGIIVSAESNREWFAHARQLQIVSKIVPTGFAGIIWIYLGRCKPISRRLSGMPQQTCRLPRQRAF